MHRRELLKVVGLASAAGATGFLPELLGAAYDPASLRARLEELALKYKVAGASVALFENGSLSTAICGVSNVATGVAMTANTVMHIGSITKTINATLLMQLVDEGLVDLDKPVLDYLPEMRTADMSALRKIKVRMLINHTSGIDGELLPDYGPDRERIADAIPRIAQMGQIHEPGKDVSYCNIAMLIAGYLCEIIKQKSWYSLIEEQIFEPLEMEHAIIQPADALLHRASVGHYIDPDGGEPYRTSFAFLPVSFAPAGATCMMSATDLVTFARMHNNDGVGPNGARILSAASAKAMRTRTGVYQDPVIPRVIGLGWFIDEESGIITHGGGGPGIVSRVYSHPESDSVIVVLTNTVTGGSLIRDFTKDFLTKRGMAPAGSGAAALAAQAAEEPVDGTPYVGTFEGIAVRCEVSQSNSAMTLTMTTKLKPYETTSTDPVEIALKPVRPGVFALAPKDAPPSSVIGFVNPDANGKYRHIAIGMRLYKRTGG